MNPRASRGGPPGQGSLKIRHTARALIVRATGAVAERLLAAMAEQLRQPRRRTVRFVDDGQDVLEWDLDASAKVVACRPCQAEVWIGTRVVGDLVPGRRLRIVPPLTQMATTFRHAVADITEAH